MAIQSNKVIFAKNNVELSINKSSIDNYQQLSSINQTQLKALEDNLK